MNVFNFFHLHYNYRNYSARRMRGRAAKVHEKEETPAREADILSGGDGG